MEGAKSLDQGPGSEEVWAPADVWAQAGLAREALEALPVAVALAVRRDGAVEPELVYGNRAFERLTGRALSLAAGCQLAEFSQNNRSAQDERCLHECFATDQVASETVLIRLRGAAARALTCEWTPLSSGTGSSGASRIWTVTPTPRRSEEHTSELQSLMRISYAVFCLKK